MGRPTAAAWNAGRKSANFRVSDEPPGAWFSFPMHKRFTIALQTVRAIAGGASGRGGLGLGNGGKPARRCGDLFASDGSETGLREEPLVCGGEEARVREKLLVPGDGEPRRCQYPLVPDGGEPRRCQYLLVPDGGELRRCQNLLVPDDGESRRCQYPLVPDAGKPGRWQDVLVCEEAESRAREYLLVPEAGETPLRRAPSVANFPDSMPGQIPLNPNTAFWSADYVPIHRDRC